MDEMDKSSNADLWEERLMKNYPFIKDEFMIIYPPWKDKYGLIGS
jgi:hypothetical protein